MSNISQITAEMENSKFAVLILTHGRPNKVVTEKTLRNCGYTGEIYYVVDDEDATYDQYLIRYGDKVIRFDKAKAEELFDKADNFTDRRTITHARCQSFYIAEELGLDYFIQLDDDYTAFDYRYNEDGKYKPAKIKNLDKVFALLLKYYRSIPALSIAMAQGGDFIGGAENKFVDGKARRKCMNTFICSVRKKFAYHGRMNEDVNMYTLKGSRGDLFLTIPFVSVVQKQTQSNSGGITELYLRYGTYVKAFYTVMHCPASVKISMLGTTKRRIHHHIRWANTVPCIVREELRKQR